MSSLVITVSDNIMVDLKVPRMSSDVGVSRIWNRMLDAAFDNSNRFLFRSFCRYLKYYLDVSKETVQKRGTCMKY